MSEKIMGPQSRKIERTPEEIRKINLETEKKIKEAESKRKKILEEKVQEFIKSNEDFKEIEVDRTSVLDLKKIAINESKYVAVISENNGEEKITIYDTNIKPVYESQWLNINHTTEITDADGVSHEVPFDDYEFKQDGLYINDKKVKLSTSEQV